MPMDDIKWKSIRERGIKLEIWFLKDIKEKEKEDQIN